MSGSGTNPDDTAVTVSDMASLQAAINAADAATTGSVVIDLANDITETSTLDAINLHNGVTLTIDGLGHTLDGASTFRGLFAYAGTLTIQNLAIDNTIATGGAGGSEGAGGGAGLGGGLFVTGLNPGLASGAAVTLNNVTFSADKAVGGAGNGSGGGYEGHYASYGTNGGGGGLGGNGGAYDLAFAGGGGGGIGGAGGGVGAAGIVPGVAGGGSGYAATYMGPTAVFAGGANGGGGGGGYTYTDSAGGGGGIGGGNGPQSGPSAGNQLGGNGGFGGGGGGGSVAGGNGGFGGGGGSRGGNGGFGGGGADQSQSAGFGAGIGSDATDYPPGPFSFYPFFDGGGGLGAGGAVFVQAGGSLTVSGGSETGGSAAGGAGGAGPGEVVSAIHNGQGLGSGYFLQGDQSITFAESAEQETVISDVIADQTGSGGTGSNAGSGGVLISGSGTVSLDASNTYTGGTSIAGGTLDLAAAGAAGAGAIDFINTQRATLQIDTAALPNGTSLANPLSGFFSNKFLDLTGLAYGPNAAATITGNQLSVSDGNATDAITLSDIDVLTPVPLATSDDGNGGILVSTPATTSHDELDLAVSEDAYDGDAQYTVSIDGMQQGGIRTASASHATGATQVVPITGQFGLGAHTVAVTFLNDAYGGTPETDRNLYLDGVTYDGASAIPPQAALYNDSTMTFIIPSVIQATESVDLGLSFAEDAYQGDARYTVAVDGQQLGDEGTVTASNSAGQTDVVSLQDLLTPGAHDLAVSFLNDLYGGSPAADRNLYLKGFTVNGAPVQSAVTFYNDGTQHFNIIVPQT